MKKIFIIAITLIALVANANAQEKVMKIQRSNGFTAEIPLSGVKRVTHGDSSWVSLGYCLYGEDFIGTAFIGNGQMGYFCCEYYVEVQENTEEPGLYRLVNPYAPGTYPYSSRGTYDDMRDYYIEINATDPDYVYLLEQDTGFEFGNYGSIVVCSRALYLYKYLGYSKDEVLRENTTGTLKNGVITFPQYGLVTGIPAYIDWPGYTYGNQNNNFKIDLNDKSSEPGPKGVKKINSEVDEVGINVVIAEDNILSE